MAWPKESRPPKPISRLNAHANSAKHITFIRNTGYTTRGASRNTATIAAKAIRSCFTCAMPLSFLGAEKAGGLEQQHDGHHDEDHRVGSLRVEHLGEALHHAQAE